MNIKTKRMAALAATVGLGVTMAACAAADAGLGAGMERPAPMGLSGLPDADMQGVLDTWLLEFVR